MQRGLSPIIVIMMVVAVVTLIGGAYYLDLGAQKNNIEPTPVVDITPSSTPPTTSTDETANWKTYSNQNIAFTFKYPPNVELTEENVIRLSLWGPTQGPETEFYDGLSLSFSLPYLNEIPLKQEVQEEVDKLKMNSPEDITVTGPYEIQVAGYKGYGYDVKGYGIARVYFIRSPKDYTVKITDGTVDPTNQGYFKIVDQILSNFKFK